MKRILGFLAVGLVACGGPNDQTVLKELRVISIRTEPALWDAQQDTVVTSTVFEVEPSTAETLTWSCLPGPDGCIEAGFGDFSFPLDSFTTVSTPNELEEVVHTIRGIPLPPEAAGIPFGPFVYTLACEPGLCPLIEAVQANPEPGSKAWQKAVDSLSDPFTLLQDYPIEGVALSYRSLEILPPESEQPAPIVVERLNDRNEAALEAELKIRFSVESDAPVTVYPFTEIGGFVESSLQVLPEEGEVSLTWVAPAEAGSGRIYVDFEGTEGRSTLWRGNLKAKK